MAALKGRKNTDGGATPGIDNAFIVAQKGRKNIL